MAWQKRGFAFLVDSEESWSMVRPTTGAPQLAASGRSAACLGTTYRLKYHYDAETTYVLGEFTGRRARPENQQPRLRKQQACCRWSKAAIEITWSSGDKLSSDTVVKAFKLEDKENVLQRDDPGLRGRQGDELALFIILIAVVILILLIILSDCSGSSGSGYRSSGGSFEATPPAAATNDISRRNTP